MRALVNLLTPEQQWWVQWTCIAVGAYAVHKVLVELAQGVIAAAWRRYRGRWPA